MNLGQLDLNLLVALDALLRERNVTRAGERIGLSQPAMSSALGRLRRLFGDELLVRVGREYYMTSLACDLIGPVQEILRLIEQTVERRPVFDPATDERTFQIATTDYVSFLLLQPLLERISTDAPGVSLQVVPLHTSSISLNRLETGDLDLVILPEAVATGSALPSERLWVDSYVCAVWTGNRHVGEMFTLEQYGALPHLAYSASDGRVPSLADQTADLLLGGSRRLQASFESFFLLPFLLRGTNLVALIHKRLGRRLLTLAETTEIRLVDPPFESPEIVEAIHWHPRSTADPAHVWLREQLQDIAATM